MRHLLNDLETIRNFLEGGFSIFTLKSKKTDSHFTYKVTASKDRENFWFVSVLTGPDNLRDYTYIGFIQERRDFIWGKKSTIAKDSVSVVAFAWFTRSLKGGSIPSELEIFHIGRCCKCGKPLTTPESLEMGIGPECRKMKGI